MSQANNPATPKQTYTIFKMCGYDLRPIRRPELLTIAKCSDWIQRLPYEKDAVIQELKEIGAIARQTWRTPRAKSMQPDSRTPNAAVLLAEAHRMAESSCLDERSESEQVSTIVIFCNSDLTTYCRSAKIGEISETGNIYLRTSRSLAYAAAFCSFLRSKGIECTTIAS